ncbi:hypothetical protein ACTFIY_008011 [Dictyostelium cf. discoideum]
MKDLISKQKDLFSYEFNVIYFYGELIDFNELYRLIEFIINKFLICSSGHVTKGSDSKIINYLYQILIKMELVTPNQVIKAYQLLQLSSISIEHSLFNAFYYLQIRSAKFTKYILSRPGIYRFLKIFRGKLYNSSIDYSELVKYYDQRGYNLANYLDPDCFTFEYVLGTNENGDYNTPFDQVLYQLVYQLIYQLSHNIINKIHIIYDFASLSMNADLEYCLDIRRVHLFFKQLEFINKQIQQTNQDDYEYQDENPTFPTRFFVLNSPSNYLLPTSELFLNREQPPIPPMPQSKPFNSEIPFPLARYYNTLKISNSVLDSALIVMNVDEIQKFIEWNCYENIVPIFLKSIFWSKFDVTQHLLTNYKIEIFSLPHHSMTSSYDYRLEFNYFISNHFERVKNPNLFKIDSLMFYRLDFLAFIDTNLTDYLSTYDIGEYQKFMYIKTREEFLNNLIFEIYEKFGKKEKEIGGSIEYEEKFESIALIFESKECQEIIQRAYDKFKVKNDEIIINKTEQQIKDYSTQPDNMFTRGFIFALTMAIKADKIHIIKFYYHNNNDNLIINLKDDQSLLDHLKSELLNHQDYKFVINWLN